MVKLLNSGAVQACFDEILTGERGWYCCNTIDIVVIWKQIWIRSTKMAVDPANAPVALAMLRNGLDSIAFLARQQDMLTDAMSVKPRAMTEIQFRVMEPQIIDTAIECGT